jgi:hypothetical protein
MNLPRLRIEALEDLAKENGTVFWRQFHGPSLGRPSAPACPGLRARLSGRILDLPELLAYLDQVRALLNLKIRKKFPHLPKPSLDILEVAFRLPVVLRTKLTPGPVAVDRVTGPLVDAF